MSIQSDTVEQPSVPLHISPPVFSFSILPRATPKRPGELSLPLTRAECCSSFKQIWHSNRVDINYPACLNPSRNRRHAKMAIARAKKPRRLFASLIFEFGKLDDNGSSSGSWESGKILGEGASRINCPRAPVSN